MKYLMLIAFCIALFSCKKTPVNTTSKYQGTWAGTYTGTGENGTFKFAVASDGKANGFAISLVFSDTFSLAGDVTTSGTLVMRIGTAPSGVFSGGMNNIMTQGGWINTINTSNYSGTWTGTKQ